MDTIKWILVLLLSPIWVPMLVAIAAVTLVLGYAAYVTVVVGSIYLLIEVIKKLAQ